MSHFGWTWRYLHWGVRWPQVQKMMLDAPWYEYDSGDDGKKVQTKQQAKRLTSQNADDIAAFINNLQA